MKNEKTLEYWIQRCGLTGDSQEIVACTGCTSDWTPGDLLSCHPIADEDQDDCCEFCNPR